ncbi:RHS repeat-associated core domain-containing protein [Duganella sp. PWIR1]
MAFWVVLINILRIALKVRQLVGVLKGLSSGKLVQSILGNFILGEIGQALAKVGVPVDSFKYVEYARNSLKLVLEAASEGLEKSGIEIKIDDLNDLLDAHIKRFEEGLSVVGGIGAQRNVRRGADPVLFQRGEFERSCDDLLVRGAGVDLLLRRVYRSGADFRGPMGRGWDHSYNLRLVETDAVSVTVLTGNLSELHFVRHPKFGQAGFNYYTPPFGTHDVLEQDGTGNFLLRRPGGGWISYEGAAPQQHRARAIHDAAGNRIDFDYDADNRLRAVYGNGPHRWLRFYYGVQGLIERVEDHAGRACSYLYDEMGSLVRVEQWSQQAGKPQLTAEAYDYTRVGDSWRLSRIYDERGRIMVENEYDTRAGSDTLGYLLNQYTEQGPVSFLYEHLPDQPGAGLSDIDQPTLRVFETLPNGHVVERLFNEAGNELLRRDDYVADGRIRTAVFRSRYNQDGAVIASMDPEGGLTQCLFGREQAALDDWNLVPATLADVSADSRLSFGNQLARVERGRAMSELDRVAGQAQWIAALPDPRQRLDAGDAVVKQVFHSRTQVLLSVSDARATVSPDPLHVESAPPGTPAFNPGHSLATAHRRLLTVHQYTAAGLRIKTMYPNRTRPLSAGGGELTGIEEEMTAWDACGRPLSRRDRLGHITYWQYYPVSATPAAGAKAGYPLSELRPHVDWTLNADFPPILEVQWQGAWTPAAAGTVAAAGAPAAVRIELPCQRIELLQSADGSALSTCVAATVTVDGAAHGVWNQVSTPAYVIAALSQGPHVVEIGAPGGALALGRIVGHVGFAFEVDALGRVVAETNPRGVVTRTTYDVLDRVLERTRGAGATMTRERFVYDHDGAVERKQLRWCDSSGAPIAGGMVETRYQRNSRRQVALEVSRAPGQSDRRVMRYYYDTLGVLAAARNGRGALSRWRVDALGRRVQESRAACSGDQSITTIAYDRCGRVLRGRDGEGGLRLNGVHSSTGLRSGYDARGRLRFMTDPLGHLTVTRYDLAGRDTVVQRFGRRPDGGFELVERHEVVYDEHGDRSEEVSAVLSQPVPAGDPVNAPDAAYLDALGAGVLTLHTTTYVLDANGRRTRIIDGARVTQFAYDPHGRMNDERLPSGRRLVRLHDGAGNLARAYAFDPADSADPASRPAAFLESSSYDELDRLVALEDAYGNVWRQRYDTLGNIEQAADPLGRRTERRCNAFRQEIARTEGLTGGAIPAEPATTQSAYDDCGNLIAVVDPLGRRLTFVYDLLDRKISARNADYPADTGTYYHYDRCGRLVRERDRNGLVSRHRYDAAGHMLRIDYDASDVAAPFAPHALSATFTTVDYDALGAVRRLENDWIVIAQTRDSRGLLLQEQTALKAFDGEGARTWRVAQSFDDAGARIGLVHPSGRATGYQRDAAGRIIGIGNTYTPPDYPGSALTAGNAPLARYRYAGGRWSGTDYPLAGATLKAAYDGRGQVAERLLTNTGATQVFWRQQVLLDGARQTALETALAGGGGRSRHFAFDALGRLAGYTDQGAAWIDPLTLAPAAKPAAPATPSAQAAIDALRAPGPSVNGFVFDAAGNRLSSREGGTPPVLSAPDNDNRYATVAATAWSYDGAGRLLSDGARRYAYDAQGRLSEEQALAGAMPTVRLIRDALGRVVVAKAADGVHYFAYLDEQTPIAHWHGAQLAEFTPGGLDREPMHVAAGGADQWIVSDALRTPRVLLQPGAVPAQVVLDYAPHGAVLAGLAPAGGIQDFAGMLRFPGSSLLHSVHRSYLPALGRFLQQDPAGIPDGPNRYSYARNNPVDLYDPLGLQSYSPMTKARVDFIASTRGVGRGMSGVSQNREVGRWFQNKLLRSFGLTENGRTFGSLTRDLATEETRSRVQPDAVSDQRYYKADTSATQFVRGVEYLAFTLADIGGKTYKDSSFWEFKAYREGTVINLGDSESQIKGMIDAASEMEATKDTKAPLPSAIHLVTTAGVTVSPEVIAYAMSKDVELVHHFAEEYINQDGESLGMRVGAGVVLNDMVLIKRGAFVAEQHAGKLVYFDSTNVRINLLTPKPFVLPRTR